MGEYFVDWFGVLVCMIYCDICDLMLLGVFINGEVGVGYMLSCFYDLLFLMFDEIEFEVFVFGVCMVQSWVDFGFVEVVDLVLLKVDVVVLEYLCLKIE